MIQIRQANSATPSIRAAPIIIVVRASLAVSGWRAPASNAAATSGPIPVPTPKL